MKRYIKALIAMIFFAQLITGCFVDDSAVTVNSVNPIPELIKEDNLLPFVSFNNSPVQLESLNKWRIELSFSEEMDPATITAASVYLRTISAAGAVENLAGHAVTYDEVLTKAYIDFTCDLSLFNLELVVTTDAKDLSGNSIAGLKGLSSSSETDDFFAYEYRVSDAGYNYMPAVVNNIVWTQGANASSGNLTVNFSRTDIDPATIDASDFIFSPAINNAATQYSEVALGTGQISFAGLSVQPNTEYTVTFTPKSNFALTAVYSGGTTRLQKLQIFDLKNNGLKTSDFVKSFKTEFSDTAVLPYAIGVDGIGTGTVEIAFSEAMDQASVTDVNNYIAYVYNNGKYENVQIEAVRPVYTENSDAITVTGVILSTVNYSGNAINKLVIKNTVLSSVLEPLDNYPYPNNAIDVDYNKDGVCDDYTIVTTDFS